MKYKHIVSRIHLRLELEWNERLHGLEEKFPMKTNNEGTTSTLSKSSRTVSSFLKAFSTEKKKKNSIEIISSYDKVLE